MAVRTVIILEQTSADPMTFRYLVRADVPTARQGLFANPAFVSAFKPFAPDVDPDLAALRSGAVIEDVRSAVITAPIAQVRTRFELEQAAFQTKVTTDQTWGRYGTFFNGTAWTPQGV